MSSTTSTFGSIEETEDALDAALAQELDAESTTVGAGWRRLVYALLSNRNLTITVAGVLVFVYFSATTRQFLSANNLLNVVRNMSLIGIVAVGMTFVLVAGEIDLSVGSVYGVLIVVLGLLVSSAGMDPWLATLVVVVLGLVIGTLNGTIVTRFGIPSFIVTLAMLTAYRSAALIISNQKPSITQGEGLFYAVTGGSIGPVPWLIVWLAVVGAVGGVVLSSWLIQVIVALSANRLPRLEQINLNSSVLLFALGISVLTALLFGLAPALQNTRLNLQDVLKEGTHTATAGSARQHFRRAHHKWLSSQFYAA